MADPLSLGIMGASALAGGLMNMFNAGSARDAQQANINAQMAMQREFATTGLQWRAGDAMKAYEATGIHPLALLGGGGATYSPVNASFETDRSMGDAVSNAGQNISRAMMASASEESRMAAVKPLMAVQLERGGLENELLKVRILSETARLRELTAPVPSVGQRMIPGQGSSPFTDSLNLIRSTFPEKDNSSVPDITYIKTPQGYVAAPSEAAKKLIEDDLFLQFQHFVRNTILPGVFGTGMNPPNQGSTSPGQRWVYDLLHGYKEVPRTYKSHPSTRRSTSND